MITHSLQSVYAALSPLFLLGLSTGIDLGAQMVQGIGLSAQIGPWGALMGPTQKNPNRSLIL